jgi:flagellar protein FliS
MNAPHLARQNYLATEVLTAAPQKLQLMLIEGAIRFGQQARALWSQQRDDEAGEAIIRCQQIVAQLLAGLRRESSSQLVQQIAGVYFFVLNSLIAAHLNRDEQKLSEALAVLAEEQATWRAVCEKLGSGQTGQRASVALEALSG